MAYLPLKLIKKPFINKKHKHTNENPLSKEGGFFVLLYNKNNVY